MKEETQEAFWNLNLVRCFCPVNFIQNQQSGENLIPMNTFRWLFWNWVASWNKDLKITLYVTLPNTLAPLLETTGHQPQHRAGDALVEGSQTTTDVIQLCKQLQPCLLPAPQLKLADSHVTYHTDRRQIPFTRGENLISESIIRLTWEKY